MNIYLDIDGVLRGVASPVEDVAELLDFIITNYPDSTYWLTTHCRQGYNHAKNALLDSELPRELVEKASEIIKPTDFGVLKTEGINFEKPFIWLDDNLFQSEQKVLEEHNCLSNHYLMNPRDPEMAKKALSLLKRLKDKNNVNDEKHDTLLTAEWSICHPITIGDVCIFEPGSQELMCFETIPYEQFQYLYFGNPNTKSILFAVQAKVNDSNFIKVLTERNQQEFAFHIYKNRGNR